MKKIFLIDGNSLLYRAYFATGQLSNNLDFPTNALYGLSNMLITILAKKPDYVVAAFDTHAPTFRHKMFADYKAQRKPPEEQLVMQMEPSRDLVRAFGVPVIEMPGYEGDDIIGTIAKKSGELGINVCVWSGDLDSLQLIDDNIKIYHTVKGVRDIKIYDQKSVKDRYDVTVEQFVDFKGLKGDPSDNIPGVPGIGDKSAAKLLNEYGSMEGIFNNIDSMKESKIKRNLIEFKEQALLSKNLAKIDTNIPIEFDFDSWEFNGFNHNDLYKLATLYQFYSLYQYIDKSQVQEEIEEEKKTEELNPIVINDENDLKTLIGDLEKEKEISFYFDFVPETKRFSKCSVYTEKLGLFEISMEKEESLFDTIVFDEPFALNIKDLKSILENENIAKIVFKSKELIKILSHNNIDIKNIIFDTYLASYIKVGNGMVNGINSTIVADVFEAVIACIYLNNGLSKAKEFIYDLIIPKIEEGNVYLSDYKSYLQELVQTTQRSLEYVLIREEGPAHDKLFEIEVQIDGIIYGKGIGKSKKEAEQNAAKDAIKKSSGGSK